MPAAHSRPAPDQEFSDSVAVSRPVGLWLLTIALLVSPVVHLAAFGLGQHWLNFGSHRPWDWFVYLLIAPIVGTLMLRRHETIEVIVRCPPTARDPNQPSPRDFTHVNTGRGECLHKRSRFACGAERNERRARVGRQDLDAPSGVP